MAGEPIIPTSASSELVFPVVPASASAAPSGGSAAASATAVPRDFGDQHSATATMAAIEPGISGLDPIVDLGEPIAAAAPGFEDLNALYDSFPALDREIIRMIYQTCDNDLIKASAQLREISGGAPDEEKKEMDVSKTLADLDSMGEHVFANEELFTDAALRRSVLFILAFHESLKRKSHTKQLVNPLTIECIAMLAQLKLADGSADLSVVSGMAEACDVLHGMDSAKQLTAFLFCVFEILSTLMQAADAFVDERSFRIDFPPSSDSSASAGVEEVPATIVVNLTASRGEPHLDIEKGFNGWVGVRHFSQQLQSALRLDFQGAINVVLRRL